MVAARLLAQPAQALVGGAHPCRDRRALHCPVRLARDHRTAVQIARADRRAPNHSACCRRHADRAQRGDNRRARRSGRAAAACDPRIPGDRGSTLLFALGHRPARYRPRRADGHRRGQHDHAATGEVHFPHARTHAYPQGARGVDCLLARRLADQGSDPRPLSLERLFRRQCVWPACGQPALFLPQAGKPEGQPGGDACRAVAGAKRLCSDQALRPCGAAHADRGAIDGRCGLYHRGRSARDETASARCAHTQ